MAMRALHISTARATIRLKTLSAPNAEELEHARFLGVRGVTAHFLVKSRIFFRHGELVPAIGARRVLPLRRDGGREFLSTRTAQEHEIESSREWHLDRHMLR